MRPMPRRKFITLAFALACLVLVAPLRAQTPATAKVTFLHTNDVYEIAPVKGRGGFAELMTALEKERAAAEHSITTFGGDLISPSLMSGLTKGAQMIELQNAVGLDLAVLGNHEFDFGPEVAKARMGESRFPWLAANVLGPDGKNFNGNPGTALRELGGFKIGFVGLLTPETATLSSPGKEITFAPVVETGAAAAKALKAAGADIVVALTHLSIAEDRELARRVREIDLILGGHDHDPITYLEGGKLIHKAGHDNEYLAVVELSLRREQTRDGPKVAFVPAWRMVPVAGIAPDPAIAAIVKKHNDRLDAELNVRIGTAATPLDSRRSEVRAKENAIGNLFADAIRAAVGADVALVNGGGIRGDRQYPAGHTLTRRDVLTELPFGNITVLIELKGSDLLAALEHAVGRVEELQGRFVSVSGLAFAYDPKAPSGKRVRTATVGGQKLDPARSYKVAANDYIVAGGDGFADLKKGKVLIDASGGKLMASQVIDYVAARGTVAPTVEGRIVAQ
ncbi:MAG: 5'-nucleotidase C-terminal domain-containing protein [Alphaproteobacteria bacterium]|nr:5'-nucleotidase C-terminal domain-containing protein [Alphaproteobacteria bacterium]